MLKAGAAQIDITPLPGIQLTGFIARLGPSTGIHDPLFARALALEGGGTKVLLITCDLLALDARFVSTVRSAVQEAAGIPEATIMIACTHTHSGPATIFLRDCGEVDTAYLDRLHNWLVETAREAVSNLREVRVAAGRGQIRQGVLNRRQPGAQVDPDLGVVSFQDRAGNQIAILLNFACHPVCLDHSNRLISADYPGVLCRTLQVETGAVVLFTNGADGDINPACMGSAICAEELGQALAEEARSVLDTLAHREPEVLQVAGEVINLPLCPLPGVEYLNQIIAEQRQAMLKAQAAGDTILGKFHKAILGWAEDTLVGAIRGILPASVQAELQIFRLEDIALLGLPGEVFNKVGKQIKRLNSECRALVIGYANGDIGYVPDSRAYEQGGYEIQEAYRFYGFPAVLAPEAGELLQKAAARLLEDFSR